MEGTGLYNYGFRYYDPTIGRFTGVDPIADQFAYLSAFNYANNDPIGKIDLHGLQGLRFSEVDDLGVTSHRVTLNIGVVTTSPWKRKLYGKKPKGRISSSFSSDDVNSIGDNLNYMFNGPDGAGRLNSAGEKVIFDFTVTEFAVGPDESYTLEQLEALAVEMGEQVPIAIDAETSAEIMGISAFNFMIAGYPRTGTPGLNQKNITTIRPDRKNDPTAQAHETGHQLMTIGNNGEHRIMSEFGFDLTPEMVDQILNDALPGDKTKND